MWVLNDPMSSIFLAVSMATPLLWGSRWVQLRLLCSASCTKDHDRQLLFKVLTWIFFLTAPPVPIPTVAGESEPPSTPLYLLHTYYHHSHGLQLQSSWDSIILATLVSSHLSIKIKGSMCCDNLTVWPSGIWVLKHLIHLANCHFLWNIFPQMPFPMLFFLKAFYFARFMRYWATETVLVRLLRYRRHDSFPKQPSFRTK